MIEIQENNIQQGNKNNQNIYNNSEDKKIDLI